MRVLTASVSGTSREQGLRVDLQLQNVGKAETDDIVQLYIQAEDSPFAPPNPVLRGFRRVHPPPGESAEMTLLSPRAR